MGNQNTYADFEAVCDFARAALKSHDRDLGDQVGTDGGTALALETLAKLHNVTYRAELATDQTVDAARRQGYTWLDIGMALGISKQAAQQKYGNQARWAKRPAKSASLMIPGSTDPDGHYYPITTTSTA